MKKRFLSAFLALALIVSLCPMAFAASGQIKASLSSAQVKQGEKVSIQFKLDENPGFVSTNIQVNWPKDDLTLMAVSGTDTITGWMGEPIPSDGKTDGKYVLAWQNNTIPSNILTTGVLCTLEFATLSSGSAGEKEITLSTDGPGQGFANFDMDTVDAVLTGGKITISSVITGGLDVAITAPMKGKTPQGDIAATAQYTGSITWDPAIAAGGKFAANTEYTANVTLTAKDGYQFAEGVTPTVDGSTGVTGVEVKDSGKTLTFNAKFPKTDTRTLEHIDIITNPALELAVPHAAPNTTETKTLTLVATSVYDAAPGGPVAATWEITNDPKLTGVSIDEATGKLTVDNKAAGGDVHVKAKFNGKTDTVTVTIKKDGPVATAIVATAPATTSITVPTGGTNTSGNCSYKVYDQYGAEMTGTTATWKMDPETVTGVTFIPANGSISVNNTATTSTVKLYAESGGVKSNEITFNITREESKPKLVTITGADSMNVPIVHAPGADGWEHKTYTAEVKDQYNNVISNPSVEWSVTGATGVSIDATTGKLTVSNKANAGPVTITAKSGDASGTKTVTINKDTAKATLVEICNQEGEAPETRLLIPAAPFTNSEAYTAKVYDQYGVYMPGEMVHWALVPATVAGVKLDTTTSTGNAILKVDSTATSGTTFKLVATSSTVTTVKGEQDITVQKKTNVSDKINFNDGSLTYTGAGQEYKAAALDSSVAAGDGGTWTYTYAVKSGGTGALDAATGLPKIVGTYTVTATYEDSSNIGSKSATLTITAKKVDIPAADNTVYIYDGTAKTYQISTSADYTVNNATQTNANEGGYIVTVSLKDEINTIWADGNTIVKHYTFKIMKATPTGEPAYTEITTSGKTLEDAALGIGTIMPAGGEIAWDDPTSTAVVANTSYGWTYTPDNTNYKPLTGTIKLWNKSTSSGGYYYAPTIPDMPMLYRGCTGDAVKTLQDKLNALGYNSGSVDGIFGAKTYAAVTAFQKANSLGVDGIVGKLTWGKLYGVSPAMPVETTTVVGRPTVSYGSRGDAVRKLQELLNALGYDCGSVDGIFGSKTKAAVLAFQKANGLGVDGIVGPLTWAKLG